MAVFSIAVIIYACSLSMVYGRYRSLQVERTILSSMFENYDKRIRPAGENSTGPVNVEVNAYVRSINNIDDVNMVYDAQLTFRQSWVDNRLRYSNKDIKYVSLTDPSMIWTPDLFFANEQSGHFHNMLLPNVLVRIFPNGRVLYSIRISLHLFCPMDLKNYPLDNQVCSIKAVSYGYEYEDLVFSWKKESPIQVSKNLMLSKFNLVSFENDYCVSITNTGKYSCIKVNFLFSRDFFYYMVQVYMPTTFMVLLSWLVFWLNSRYSEVRFGILITVLISSILITTSINSQTPQVSYTKAIDVWIGVCIFFILCSILELCLVLNAISKEEEIPLKNPLPVEKRVEKIDVNQLNENGKLNQLRKFASIPMKWLNNYLDKYLTTALKIDAVSRIAFPASFIFFNFIYWLKYAAGRGTISYGQKYV